MAPIALGFPLLTVWAATTLAALGLAVTFGAHGVGVRRRLSVALAERNAATAVAAASERLLRLATNDFRAPALTLMSHAEQLTRGCADPARHGSAIAAIAEQLLGLADTLQDHGLPGAQPRVLRKESLCVGEVLADAIAGVSGALEPGHRHWRVSPDLDGRKLFADRRALNQILLRVLTNAVRLSRHDDWIDISCMAAPCGGLTLIVADEGHGLVGLDPPWSEDQPDNRGLGLGLSLARALMVAHGGTLSVESAARVGARVTLHFPAERATTADLLAA
jgi:two-component system sensor histidine kinase VicK